ncbi:MAG TPA: type I-U CRISPR-associated protein Csb2, partial [Pirellulales bacterium]
RRLVENLSTLGRAEGWVQGELTGSATTDWNCSPAASANVDQELVSVFCPDPATAFGNDHYPSPPDAKKLKKGLKPSEYLFDCPRWHLCLDTETVHGERWPRVPGARWVSYARQADAFTRIAASPPAEPSRHKLTVARFLIDGPVLPPIDQSLPLAEEARHQLLCHFRVASRGALSPALAGKDADGQPLHGHQHAFYFPTDEDDDGRLDHLTICLRARAGGDRAFSRNELDALDRLRSLRLGERNLNLLLVGLGQAEDFRNTKPFTVARQWLSATPFVASRFPKERGQKRDPLALLQHGAERDFAGAVLLEEARRAELSVAGVTVEPLAEQRLGRRGLRPVQFCRRRVRKAGDDGERRACGAFRLTFAEPVPGPVCLGHGCHFGLGLFLPVAAPE